MFNFFKRRKWVLVKVFKYETASYTYHARLYETLSGKRKVEFVCDGNPYNIDRKDAYLKKTDFYQMKIFRWVKGRTDPDVPAADKVEEQDTFDCLKGSQ